jgi:hypothetical protein
MIAYPDFPLSTRHDHSRHAWWRTASRIGVVIAKIPLVIVLAAIVGVTVGAALGFVVVVATI